MPEFTQYRVDASINFAEDAFWDISTDWMPNRDTAIEIMERLKDDGHIAEVHTRKIHAATKEAEVPER